MISKFVALTDYCVLEYQMTPLGYVGANIINSNYYFVTNSNIGMNQIYNTDDFNKVTNNSRGYSVVPISGGRLIHIQLTDLPLYTQYDPNITETYVNSSLTNALVFDNMRFHFASGFNFTEVQNVILGARFKLNNMTELQVANVLVNSESYQSLLTFNNKPLFLGNTIYDKYVDIKIPNPAYLDQNFTTFQQDSFEFVVTQGKGLINNSPITVSLAEAVYEDYYAPNGTLYQSYRVTGFYEGPITQVNEFDNLGATIQEATDGDYIQFFATWNNGFPDSLIAYLNSKGSDQNWIIIHQLQVYEQVGNIQVPSGNFLVYQQDTFDVPLTYRPILLSAGQAIAMSIDYTVTLLNKLTGEQIIRTGSMTLFNPNKYGKQLAKIELSAQPQSMKVYNKVVSTGLDASNLFVGATPINGAASAIAPTTVQIQQVQVIVPTFYKQANIKVSYKNALLKTTDNSAEVIYGQGSLVLPIDPTDNYIKFSVYEVDPNDIGNYTFANLNNTSSFTLTFGMAGTLSYNSLSDASVENPSKGQIAFRIPKDQAKKVLQLTDNIFYISLIGADGTETLMYTGSWVPSTQYSTVLSNADSALNSAKSDPSSIIADLRNSIADLETKNASLQAQIITQPSTGAISVKENHQTINSLSSKVPASLVSTLVNPNVENIITSAISSTQTTTIKPGNPTKTQTIPVN